MVTSDQITKGFFWRLIERFGVQGIQFVLQIILARLLEPEHYGILAIMVTFTSIANVIIQNGFNTALIQSKNVEEEDYSSVLWISLVIAGVLYLIIFGVSPIIADFYEMEDIIAPLRILALMLFPGALNSVQLAKLSRAMDFKTVFFSNVLAMLISGVVGVIFAYMGGGLWALVAQTLLNVIVASIVMYFTAKFRIYWVCNLRRVKKLFSYGWKILISSVIDTLYQDLRSLVIGKKYDSSTLGFYNRGKQFPQFVINAINGAVQSVLLPAMAKEQDNRVRVKVMMRTSITVSAYIIFPMMAGLAAIAEPLVVLLLTEKWLPCVPYLQIYCLTFAFYPVHACNLQAINAIGRSDIFLRLEIIKKSYGLILLIIAVYAFKSPIAIALTGVLTTLISCFVNAGPNKRLVGYSYFEQMRDLSPAIFMSITMYGVVYCIGKIHMKIIFILILQVIAGVAFYFVLSIIIKPEPYIILKRYVKSVVKK